MPNWVYNHVGGYTKNLHDKYKSKHREIDFDKVIPMPEEIKDSVSCSYNNTAKRIYEYEEFKEMVDKSNTDNRTYYTPLRSTDNPISDDVERLDKTTAIDVGHLCIANPDKALNDLLEKEENSNSFVKHRYNKYIAVFGKSSYMSHEDPEKMFSNYIALMDKEFKKFQSSKANGESSSITKFKSIGEYGKHLKEVKEKYGYDNWYDWSCANWGTKWNACESEYDEETEQIHFDTAWSIPYPIFAKIAEQNPDVNLDGYSEEEQGWFDEYTIKDKKVTINATGEIGWNEETDERVEYREELKPKRVIYFDSDGKFIQEEEE